MKRKKSTPAPATVPPPAPEPPRKTNIELTIAQIIAEKQSDESLPPLLTAWQKLKVQSYPGVIAWRIQRVWRELKEAWEDYEEVRCNTVKRLGEPHPIYGYWIPDNNIDAINELKVILRDYSKNIIPISLTGRLPFPWRNEFTPEEMERLDTLGLIDPPEGFVAPTSEPLNAEPLNP